MRDKNIAMAERIAREVASLGGRAYYVGGFVRDRLLNIDSKDVDIEIHGVSVKALEALLDTLGERTAMGASFGVMGLRHYDLDIALPRSERAIGRGHKDFEVWVDPFIGPQKAALRRDFTMNALMEDILSGEILDFFGGRGDLAEGRIRHVNAQTFVEDPLRAFRAAQFAARFQFEVAPETIRLCSGMAVEALASERVLGEMNKALLKAARPSVFFEILRAMNQLDTWFGPLARLPEPNWRLVMATLDAAAGLREEAPDPAHFMLLTLCAGFDAAQARAFLAPLTNEVEAYRCVLNGIECLDVARSLLEREAPEEDEWLALYDAAESPEALILMERAVHLARGDAAWPETEARLRALLALYGERMATPFAMGRDLIEAGVKPGPRMGEALRYAHALRLRGASKAEQLEKTLHWLREGPGED